MRHFFKDPTCYGARVSENSAEDLWLGCFSVLISLPHHITQILILYLLSLLRVCVGMWVGEWGVN